MQNKLHKIEVGDILQHGVWEMNEKLKLPALYKVVSISTGTEGFKMTTRDMGNDKDYFDIVRELQRKKPECDLCNQEVDGKHAFTAVIGSKDYFPYGIGRANKGKKGYTPQPQHGWFSTYAEAEDKASELNKKLGLTVKEAWELVAGTMG